MRKRLWAAAFAVGLFGAQGALAQQCEQARAGCLGMHQNPCGPTAGWSCAYGPTGEMQRPILQQAIQQVCEQAEATCANEQRSNQQLLTERLNTFHRCVNDNLNNPRVCDSLNPSR